MIVAGPIPIPRFDDMQSRYFMLVLSLVFSAAISTVAFADAKDSQSGDASAKDGKKNTTILVLEAKPEAIHAAALEALASIGCQIKKDSPLAIEAKRPNKVGLAVGSGGEKLLVTIKSVADGKTEVKVVTKKTMMGVIGQKRWNDEVAAHIRDAIK